MPCSTEEQMARFRRAVSAGRDLAARICTPIAVLLACAGLLSAAPSLSRQRPDPPAVPTQSGASHQLEMARMGGFPVLLIFSAEWCRYCQRMEDEVYQSGPVAARMADFVVVRADLERERELAARFAVRGVPAFVLISSDGSPTARKLGFMEADPFLDFLGAPPRMNAGEESVSRSFARDQLPREIVAILARPRGELTANELAEVFLAMRDPRNAGQIRDDLEKGDLPGKSLLALLEHPLLAVRIAALEFLEGSAGGDFGYSPWLDDPAGNASALARWQSWANGESANNMPSPAPPTEEDLLGALNDLTSGDPLRADRGRRTISAVGTPALAVLAAFAERNPSLPAEGQALLREMRYTIFLKEAGTRNARSIARRLVFAPLDTRLGALRECAPGPWQQRIFEDFLAASDPIEREAAIDRVATLSSEIAGPILLRHYEIEHDENVRHLVLRRLSDLDSPEARRLLERETSSASEDLAIVAIEALGHLKAKDKAGAIHAALADPRWRVRVAALKTLQEAEIPVESEKLDAMLDDSDEFVRISAIQTIGKREIAGSRQRLERLFPTDPALRPAIINALCKMEIPISGEIISVLSQSPVEEMLAALSAVPDAGTPALGFLEWAASHKNPDVAASAMRMLGEGSTWKKDWFITAARVLQKNPTTVGPLFESVSSWANHIQRAIPEIENARMTPGGGGRTSEVEKAERDAALHFRECLAQFYEGAGEHRAKLHAGILLSAFGDGRALALISGELGSMEEPTRVKVARFLNSLRTPEAAPLFRTLLRDRSASVRSAAIDSLLDSGVDVGCVMLTLDELVAPGALLDPSALWKEMPSPLSGLAYSQPKAALAELSQRLKDLAADAAHPNRVVLAVSALGRLRESTLGHSDPVPVLREIEDAGPGGDVGGVAIPPPDFFVPYLESPVPEVRRAAHLALWNVAPTASARLFLKMAGDDSPLVREIPAILLTEASVTHETLFVDLPACAEYVTWRHRTAGVCRDLLAKLASDPVPRVAGRATVAQITRGEPFDPEVFAAYRDRENVSKYTLEYILTAAFKHPVESLPPEFARVLPSPSEELEYDSSVTPQIHKARMRFAAADAEIPSRESLIGKPAGGDTPQGTSVTDPASTGPVPGATDQPVRLVYFTKPGCDHCAEVAGMLTRLRESFPEIEVLEWNINRNRSMEFNEALSERFGTPETLRLVAPAVFAAGGYLVKDDISESRLGQLVLSSRGREAAFLAPLEQTLEDASGAISTRYEGIGPAVIGLAGFLDGLNPCAFATIIFLLSYLQISGETRARLLAIGISYIGGVFTAYFLLGLGLAEVVGRLGVLQKTADVVNLAMGLFAVVIGVLSIRDGILCLQGRLAEMSLQLPAGLKAGIHKVIRTTARRRMFIVAAFGVGALISVLELSCTGQVYAPTIIYMLQSGEKKATVLLLLYNIAFILPLLLVFAAAYFGMTSTQLTAVLKKRAATVKFALAALFLLLAGLLLSRFLV